MYFSSHCWLKSTAQWPWTEQKLSTWEWLCKYRDYCSQSWAQPCLTVEVHSLGSIEQKHLVISWQHCRSPEPETQALWGEHATGWNTFVLSLGCCFCLRYVKQLPFRLHLYNGDTDYTVVVCCSHFTLFGAVSIGRQDCVLDVMMN